MTSTLTLQIASKTHIGRVREMNQDSFAIFRRAQLLDELDALVIVADGMGGGKGGEVASRIVAETLPNVVIEVLADGEGRDPDPKRMLKSGIQRANNLVRSRSIEKRELEGMGTTCTAVILNRGTVTLGHAGDSRTYLLRDGKLRQVTEDHSLVWQEVLSGKMTREEAQKSKFRNQITKSVGLAQEVDPDVFTFALQEGDTLLLCSDGLTTEVADSEIARTLASSPDPQAACDQLTQAALEAGGSDNITVVVVRYGAFTPLSEAVSVSPIPERAPFSELPEDATDERSEWRSTLKSEAPAEGFVTTPVRNFDSASPEASRPAKRSAERPAPPLEEESEEEEEAPQSGRSRRKRVSDEEIEERAAKSGGFLRAVCVLLLSLTIGMGIALSAVLQSRGPSVPLKIGPATHTNEDVDLNASTEGPLRTDKDLFWEDPETFYDQPVREDLLLPLSTGEMVVAHPDGKCYRISQKGKASLLPGPDLPKVSDKVKPDALTVFDPSGNRYQYNPKTKHIVKYDASGAIVKNDIGRASFVAPTRLAMDRDGNLFALDEHRLKQLKAYESGTQIKQDYDNKKNKASGTLP